MTSTSVSTNPTAALDVVEAAHDGQGDWQAWSDRILSTVAKVLASPFVNLGIARRAAQSYQVVAASSSHPLPMSCWEVARYFPPAALDPYWRDPAYVSTSAEIAARHPAPERLAEFMDAGGVDDILGLVAVVDDWSLAIGAPQPGAVRLEAHQRQLLTQLIIHVEVGLRLRLCPQSAIAVLHPDGRVVHADGTPGRDAKARAQLVDHVALVERSRRQRARCGGQALDAWQALIAGRWGLVERTEPGGARHYVVLEVVRGQRLRALSPLEAHALELSARGLMGKAVAYGLGVSPATVSKLLGSAAIKLGVRNRTRLVQLVAQLLATDPLRSWEATITPAERNVLDLVRLGWTNKRIAEARGRSERTVANQVAALLRKVEVPSRRGLATR